MDLTTVKTFEVCRGLLRALARLTILHLVDPAILPQRALSYPVPSDLLVVALRVKPLVLGAGLILLVVVSLSLWISRCL